METKIFDNEKEIDYSQLIILKELDTQTYNKIYQYIHKKLINKIITPRGVAINKNELQELTFYERRGRHTTQTGYKIDLSTPSRMNCLYKRIASMNKTNKDYCESKSKLPKYVAQDGYLYVNIKDMCKPQIKQLAKRLECKEHEIVSCLFDLLHKKYLKERGEIDSDDS